MKLDPVELSADSLRNAEAIGTEGLAMYRALAMSPQGVKHNGQYVRVMLAREPAGTRGEMLWHVSISIGPFKGPPSDRPRDGQCNAVVNELHRLHPALPLLVEDHHPDNDPQVRHFWEEAPPAHGGRR